MAFTGKDSFRTVLYHPVARLRRALFDGPFSAREDQPVIVSENLICRIPEGSGKFKT
jgi:hypothetical protein